MRSGVKTVYFNDRKALIGVIAHYATLHKRVKIVTPRGIVEDFAQRVQEVKANVKRFCVFCKTTELTDKQQKYCCVAHAAKHIGLMSPVNKKRVTKICRNKDCKKEFIPAQKKFVFCSVDCRAHYTKRKMKICKNPSCGKEFRPKKSVAVYCSLECSRQNLAKKVK